MKEFILQKEIFGLTLTELQTELSALGMQKFRASQVFQWLYQKSVFDFQKMTNLAPKDRDMLAEKYSVLPAILKIAADLKSSDGLTEKLLLELPDGNTIETVLMHHDYGYSVCVSSQVGCNMHCAFCASGLNGCVRDLTKGEILAQVYLFNARLAVEGSRVSRVVVMGSGEPLLNFDNVLGALDFLHDPKGANMSYRNMTISTCGIVPGMKRLATLGQPINLAVSLHAVRSDLRNELMPINKTYPLTEVLAAAEEYAEKSGRQVTYEYILLAGKNDSDADAELLADYMRFKHATVNVIPVNPVPEQGFVRPGRKKIDRFMAALEKRRVNATLRIEMGADINAACGQLRASHLKKAAE
jgi:23S rRNA (adenine2503-C2)-methyltransferase